MKFGSLFSGIGGFDLGFEPAGMECAWQCEIDKHAQGVLKRRFGVEVYENVKTITAAGTEPVELICGGFPCQDVSIAGRRAGLAGERSGLWHEFHRIIAEFTPQWVVIENVPGLLSSNGGQDFAVILRGLVECRYGVSWRILDSQYFGVAQRRRRVFIVGSLGSGRSAQVLFESEGLRGDPPARRKAGEGDTGTAADSAGEAIATYQNTGYGYWQDKEIATTIRTPQGGGALEANLAVTSRYWDGGDISDTLDVSVISKQQMMPERRRFAAVLCVGAAPTLSTKNETASSGPARDAWYNQSANMLGAVRRLTPLECERLQGFPDGWTEGQSDTQRYKQLGNAVTVNVAEWIGRRIIEASNR